MAEKQIILPLTADEIKDAMVTKVCEALYDAMNKTCNLYGCAYPKFKAEGEIRFTLDNYGDVRLDRVILDTESEGEWHAPVSMDVVIDVPFTPPNVLRKQTGQSIPVIVEGDDGSIEQKAVFYRRERTSRIGRANAESDL
jgi:hypothetical protein